MLSMSVEHANQLRQLIVEKHRPQPAGLANVYSLIIIYYSQCTIRQPKVIFLHMPAGKHKKKFISWDSQCLSHKSSIKNIALLDLWHGKTKPKFKLFLENVTMHIKSVINIPITITGVGTVTYLAKNIVADMPATASCLFMKEHMGYYSCTFC